MLYLKDEIQLTIMFSYPVQFDLEVGEGNPYACSCNENLGKVKGELGHMMVQYESSELKDRILKFSILKKVKLSLRIDCCSSNFENFQFKESLRLRFGFQKKYAWSSFL